MSSWEEDDAADHVAFLDHLEKSKRGVWIAAQWLANLGYNVQINGMASRAPTHGEWKEYADNGDLCITQRIEVKQRSFPFTCREDWPFRDGVIVCAKHSFDNAKPKPFAYVHLNGSASHAVLIRSATRPSWTVRQVNDRRYKVVAQPTYFAPLDVVEFSKLKRSE